MAPLGYRLLRHLIVRGGIPHEQDGSTAWFGCATCCKPLSSFQVHASLSAERWPCNKITVVVMMTTTIMLINAYVVSASTVLLLQFPASSPFSPYIIPIYTLNNPYVPLYNPYTTPYVAVKARAAAVAALPLIIYYVYPLC